MAHRIRIRHNNGRFKRGTLADLGFKVAEGKYRCKACGLEWWPILVDGQCPKCGAADSEPVAPAAPPPAPCTCRFPSVLPRRGAKCPDCGGVFE